MASGVPRKRRALKAAIDLVDNRTCWNTVKTVRPKNTGETCVLYYYYHLNGAQWTPNYNLPDLGQQGPIASYAAFNESYSPYNILDNEKNTYSFRTPNSVPHNLKKAFFTAHADPSWPDPNSVTHWGGGSGWNVSHWWFCPYLGTPTTASLAGQGSLAGAKGRGVLYTNEGPQTSYIPCVHTVPSTCSIQIPTRWTGSIEYNTTHTQSFLFGVYGAIGQGDTLNIYCGGADGFQTLTGTFGPSVNSLAGAHFWSGNPGPPNTNNYSASYFVVPTGNLPIQVVLSQSATDQTPKAGLMITWTGWNKTVYP